MDIRKFMKRKSVSDRRSVENNSDKRFQKVSSVQPVKTNERTANVFIDSSSPFQTQLCEYAPIQQNLQG